VYTRTVGRRIVIIKSCRPIEKRCLPADSAQAGAAGHRSDLDTTNLGREYEMEFEANIESILEREIRQDLQILDDDFNRGHKIPNVAESHSVHIMGHI